jgi:4-aminobutyrate aminotransferase
MTPSSARPTSVATWLDRDAESVSPAYSRYSHLVVERAEGSHLFTVDGREVLDFGCGIAVTNLGHGHPDVVRAVHEQVDRLWHTSVTAIHPRLVEASEALVSVSPEGLDSVFLCNSGAEAVEASIKLARRATGRSEIIAFTGAFHGRTYGALSLTASKWKYRSGMGPFLPGIHHVRYPHCFQLCSHGRDEPCPIAEGEDIQRLFDSYVPPDSVAAIIVEPLQGEGGYVVPPKSFMPTLRRICDDNGILLIADEVQSGFGRTGRMFAVEHSGVTPDIMTVAKAMGNGLPVAAMVARHSVMRSWHPGEHGTTYGGNAVSCAAVVAVIEVIRREKLEERAAQLGRRVMDRVLPWKERFPKLGDVRGLGLMVGLEFMDGRRSDHQFTEAVMKNALDRDLLLLNCGLHGNVIRLIPPLTISEADLDHGLDVLEESIAEAAR